MDMKEAHEKGIEAGIEASGMGGWDHIEERVTDFLKAYLSASNQVLVPREPIGWFRSGFVVNWSIGPEKPEGNTTNKDEWRPVYAAAPNHFKNPEESREKK